MLIKSTFREIRTSLARYLAIFSIVALGVGFFSGLKDCKESMVKTTSEYLDSKNFYDYMILSSYGIDDESVRIAEEWDGVSEAEDSIQIDMMAAGDDGDAKALKFINLPENLNLLNVVEGRLPENPNECVVDSYSITDEGLQVGETIKIAEENDEDKLKEFKVKEFEVVGTVNTPIYLDYQRGSTDIGNGSLYSFIFVDKEVMDTDYSTNLYLRLKSDAASISDERDNVIEANEDSMEDLAERVTEARREKAMAKAQEKLDKKKKEYEDNLAEYESEKSDTEKKLRDYENELKSNERKAKKSRKRLDSEVKKAKEGIAAADKELPGLKEKKKGAEAELAGLKSQKQQLEEAKAAGLPIDDIDAQIAQVDAGINEADSGLRKINAGITQAESGRKKAEKGLKDADAAYKKLDAADKKIRKGKKELASQKRRAEEEFSKAEKELDDAKEKLDEAQQKIDDMEIGNSYALSRDDNVGYASFDSNSNIVNNIAKVFPVFFFLIAALVCMTTMTRMIDEQRTQIGVLKALGYSSAAIAGKYLFYSGSAAFLGAVVGFFAGCKIFPAVIWNAYTMMYDFSDDVAYVINPKLGLISLTVALVCSMGATWFSMAADFKVEPSNLIRPRTPKAGKRILLERIGPVWRRVSFLYKVSFRNIFRDKKRFLMMVIGVSGCTALLVAGLGIRTTISKVADYQFDEISLYDFSIIFNKNMNEERKAEFTDEMKEAVPDGKMKFIHQSDVTLLTGKESIDVSCVATDEEGFSDYVSLHKGEEELAFPGEGEIVIIKKLNHDYGINIGDEITLREDYREMKVRVSGIADNYVYDMVYISPETYEKGFGKKPDIKAGYYKLSDDATEAEIRDAATKAANYEYTAAVQVNLDVKDSVSKMMESLNSVVYVVILSAALLAFIVLYNLTNINITERVREIATIKVLGFRQLEVSQYVFRENLFLTAVAAVVGMPVGRWLLNYVIDNIVVKIVYFEPRLNRIDYVIAVILTFVFAFIVNLVMLRRLNEVSMTESLKSVE